VIEIVALVFQRVKSFVVNFPPASPGFHDLVDIAFAQFQKGHPGKTLDPSFAVFFMVEEVDPDISIPD
jgi:hypothetical protein